MKQYLKSELVRMAQTLNRISMLAEILPDDGPAPWMVSPQGTGQIYYSAGDGQKNLAFLKSTFGPEGWTLFVLSGTHSLHKVLENGVTVQIDNVDPGSPEIPIDCFRMPKFEASMS